MQKPNTLLPLGAIGALLLTACGASEPPKPPPSPDVPDLVADEGATANSAELLGQKPAKSEVALQPDGYIIPKAEAQQACQALVSQVLEQRMATPNFHFQTMRLSETDPRGIFWI